jgi:arginyl-tRNA synthetase
MTEHLDPKKIEDLGKAYVIGATAYEDNPKAKEEIDGINKKLYAGDLSLKEMYDTGRKTSLDRFEDLYKILGTRFDHYFFESETVALGKKLVQDGISRGILEKSDGAIIYRGEKHGLHTRVFITSQGTPTYEAKELGLVELKREQFPFDLAVTTIAVEQDGYFKVVEAAIAEFWPELKGRYIHVSHGMMQLAGGKMSSRKGNVVTGESLIEDMRNEARAKMADRELADKECVVDAVAVAAIKYSVLKQGTGKNIVFDPKESLSFEGDSGPYLQYSYVRARSVLERAESGKSKVESQKIPESIPVFERLLPRFPDVVLRAAKEYEPHYVTTYLTELAGAFNSWYAGDKILGSSDEAYKLMLVRAFAHTMHNGLWLLGIQAPEKM